MKIILVLFPENSNNLVQPLDIEMFETFEVTHKRKKYNCIVETSS